MAAPVKIPAAVPGDPEDVSWALSTAEAMYGRGDVAEALKWVRRAAEAASEAENDDRALELAKAAADLTAAMSAASAAPPAPPAGAAVLTKTVQTPVSALPPSVRAAQIRAAEDAAEKRASAPRPAAGAPPSVRPPPAGLDATRPTSRPPPAATGEVPTANAPHSKPPSALPPRPLATAVGPERSGKPTGAVTPLRARRKSNANLDAEARAARLERQTPPSGTPAATMRSIGDEPSAPTVEVPAIDEKAARELLNQQIAKKKRRSRPDGRARLPSTTDEWDAFPTQSLTGDELATITGTNEHKLPPPAPPPKKPSDVPARTSVVPIPAAASGDDDDATAPPLVATQAIRVVLWKDAQGVHVAPAGTVVSAITVDALVVALDPAADISAWFEHFDVKP